MHSVFTEAFDDVIEIISDLMNHCVSQSVFPNVYLIGSNAVA